MTSFREWLEANHYRTSTVVTSTRAVACAERAYELGNPLPESCRYAMQRALTYHKALGARSEFSTELMQWAVAQGASEVKALPKAKPKRRLREAKSFDDGDWKRLRATLKASNDDCDRVLYVILMTGLRVGDVLRTPRSEIDKALRTQILEVERKGGTFVQVPIAGLEDAWTALRDKMRRVRAPTVAAFICPANPSPEAGDAAYKALSRRLLDLGRELGVTGRIHIHRFRRTIAVRGLAVTADTGAVQQLLGVRAITTVQRYTDETRVDAVSKTRKLIHDDE